MSVEKTKQINRTIGRYALYGFGGLLGLGILSGMISASQSQSAQSSLTQQEVSIQSQDNNTNSEPENQLIVTVGPGVSSLNSVMSFPDLDTANRCMAQAADLKRISEACQNVAIMLYKGTKVKIESTYDEPVQYGGSSKVEVESGYKAGSEVYIANGVIENTKDNYEALSKFIKGNAKNPDK